VTASTVVSLFTQSYHVDVHDIGTCGTLQKGGGGGGF